MLFLQSLSAFLFRALVLFQASPLRADWEEKYPPKKSLLQRLNELASGDFSIGGLFHPKYLIHWVELFVILSLLLFAAYLAHALNLYRRRA